MMLDFNIQIQAVPLGICGTTLTAAYGSVDTYRTAVREHPDLVCALK